MLPGYVCMYVCMYIYKIAHNRAIRPCHPSHSMPLALILPRRDQCMYVCMYVCMTITYSKSKDQPGKVANPARGQLNMEMNTSLSPFAPENLVSRDEFGSPVPRQPAHLHTSAESGAYSQDSSRFPRRRPFIYLNRHTPSSQSRVHRVTQVRTGSFRCRESAGTGPVNLKVVPATGAAFASPWAD